VDWFFGGEKGKLNLCVTSLLYHVREICPRFHSEVGHHGLSPGQVRVVRESFGYTAQITVAQGWDVDDVGFKINTLRKGLKPSFLAPPGQYWCQPD